MFVAGERERPEVCYNPKSDKWRVMGKGVDETFCMQSADYWDGEDD